MTLGSAEYHAVSAQNGIPVMGCVQNTLTMAGVCTNIFDLPRQAGDQPTTLLPDGSPGYEILIPRNTACDAWVKAGFSAEEIRKYISRVVKVYPQYVSVVHPERFKLAEYVTGKIIYSIVFPEDLRWKKATKTNKYFPKIIIRDGIIMPDSAPLCKSAIGATGGSVIHLEWRRHPRLNKIFINRLVAISSVLNFPVGFSFSFGDCQAQEKVVRDIKIAVEEANFNVKAIIQKNLDPEDEEKEINGAYNRIREIAPTIEGNMIKGMHSSLSILTTFGIKGNLNNVTQTAGITGQQNLSAKRIPWSITNKTRMTAHFLPNDKSPAAKGLIFSSYLGGLNYKESMAAAIAGREGVVATGTKTADSGYAQKKLSKFISDIRAYGDGTLRNAQGRIITTIYGGDGISPKMKMMSHSMENEVISGERFMTFVKIDHLVLTLESRFEAKVGALGMKYPPKIKITLDQAETIASGLDCGAPGYQNKVIRQATQNLRESIVGCLVTISTYQEIILDLTAELVEEFERAKVYDGYPAGLVACLSIGEIGTQLTLNTFHSTGIGDKSSSAGIARYNETLNVTAKPKNPGMTIYLRDPGLIEAYALAEVDPEKSKLLGLERATVLAASFRYHDVEGMLLNPPTLLRVGEYDPTKESPLSFEGAYDQFEEPEWMTFLTRDDPVDLHEWVIRIDLDTFKLYESSLTTFDIAEIIEVHYESSTPSRSVRCVPSPNILGQVLIFLNPDDVGGYAREKVYYPEGLVVEDTLYTPKNISFFATREIAKTIITVQLGGIHGITKAIPRLEGKEWVIDTHGTNLVEVLSDPLVDPTRTISDHFREMEAVLGIEAGRAYLEEELRRVVKFDGAEVDDCHFSVVADAMSFSGVLTPISRHGISRDVGPISKLMFERPVVEAANAVIYGDIDPLKTIDAAVYVGQAPKLGTGVVKVVSGEIARSAIVPGGSRGYHREGEGKPRVVKAR